MSLLWFDIAELQDWSGYDEPGLRRDKLLEDLDGNVITEEINLQDSGMFRTVECPNCEGTGIPVRRVLTNGVAVTLSIKEPRSSELECADCKGTGSLRVASNMGVAFDTLSELDEAIKELEVLT